MKRNERHLKSLIKPEWNGRQKRSLRKDYFNGGHKHSYKITSVTSVREKSFVESINLFPWFPKAFQKKRPQYPVHYKCECEFGYTGYNCQGLNNFILVWRNRC